MKYLLNIAIFLGSILISSCFQLEHKLINVSAISGFHGVEVKLREEVEVWSGTPYKNGGKNRLGVDCSAFVGAVYKNVFGVILPRTTKKIAGVGNYVRRSQLRAGDLVFFFPPGRSRHIGIYLGRGEFAHASTSKGVIISDINGRYWSRIYWMSRRL